MSIDNYAISERELEDYICDNQVLENYDLKIIARQMKVGSAGILDILCMNRKTKDLVVVELKKGEINPEAQFQADRYKKWLEYKLELSVNPDWSDERINKRFGKCIATLIIGTTAHKDMFLVDTIHDAYRHRKECYDYGCGSFYTLADISLQIKLGYTPVSFGENLRSFEEGE